MEKLKNVIFYLNKCLREMPQDVLPRNPKMADADAEIILTAMGNVLCTVAWNVGATRESVITNITELWDQIETVLEAEEKNRVLN